MTTISPDHPTSAGFFDRKTARPARRITVLAGTNRPGSATRQIAGILVAHYVALQQEVNILDLAELPLEAFAPSAYARKPDSLYPFFQSVLNADGLHVVTPEYNGGPPGALKYFIDLLPYPEAFADRAVCFTGLAAGKWGALRSVEQLQLIVGYGKALVFPERVFLPNIGERTSGGGSIVDVKNEERLEQQARNFVAFIQRVSTSLAPHGSTR